MAEETTTDEKKSGVRADSAEADGITAAGSDKDLDLGKFRNARELQSAYFALEKEFTRKCQELNLLRKNKGPEKDGNPVNSTDISVAAEAAPIPAQPVSAAVKTIDEDIILKNAVNNEKVREIIISQYLKSVKTNGVRLIGDAHGAYVITPPKKPKSLKDAGEIARKIFK